MFSMGDLIVGALSLLIAGLAYALGRQDGAAAERRRVERAANEADRALHFWLGA